LVPTATTVALLVNPNTPSLVETMTRELQAAAHTLGLQKERDARAAAAQRRLVAAAAQQNDWIWRCLKRQYEHALAAPLSPRLATLITQLETRDVGA